MTDPTGQEADPYLHAADDPCNRIDPTGEVRWLGFTKGCAAASAVIGLAIAMMVRLFGPALLLGTTGGLVPSLSSGRHVSLVG